MSETITPIPRPDFTEAEFRSVEFQFHDGALGGLIAQVAFGQTDAGRFARRRSITVELSKAQVAANLTAAEKSALASIKTKLMQAAISQL